MIPSKTGNLGWALIVNGDVTADGGTNNAFNHEIITYATLGGLRSSFSQSKTGVVYFDLLETDDPTVWSASTVIWNENFSQWT